MSYVVELIPGRLWLRNRVTEKAMACSSSDEIENAVVFGDVEEARAQAEMVRRQWPGYAEVVAVRATADPIHDPAHYQARDGSGIECVDANRAMLTPDEFRGWLRGTLNKYLWRYRDKGGEEDLCKAQQFLDWLKEHEERNGSWHEEALQMSSPLAARLRKMEDQS